ncbi:MAG: AmmeMemoRadiSam system protein B [Elusimicrobia bacterium]|nr:AmmeMemoRadiSam system protein B [Elusimicrobiota bacterium]
MKRVFLVVLFFSLIVFGCGAESKKEKKIKKMNYAGSWYPAQSQEIEDFINYFLSKSTSPVVDGEIIGIVFPHAGWKFTAPVAAADIRALLGRKFDTVVLLGPSHYVGFDGAALGDYDLWQTPFGEISVNREFENELAKIDSVKFNNIPQQKEHSTEVVMPFLMYALKDFSVVPVVMGQDWGTYKKFARKLAALYRKGILFVASSDMSHYFTYEQAENMDGKCLSFLSNYDINGLEASLRKREVQLCGAQAVLAVMLASKLAGANAAKVLKYANSGDTTGDKNRVVGYGAVCFYKKGVPMLNKEEKRKLIEIARKTIKSFVTTGKVPDFEIDDERLKEIQGAFVTINESGRLRGCIGNIVGVKPLWETVRDMAVEAATRDPRFPPVDKSELGKIDIEVSVLTPLKRAKPEEIVLGRDGVVVKKGFRQGVYLPQVATETGWSKEEFLSSLCAHKAGLPADAWKEPDTELYVFQADVFSEKEAK